MVIRAECGGKGRARVATAITEGVNGGDGRSLTPPRQVLLLLRRYCMYLHTPLLYRGRDGDGDAPGDVVCDECGGRDG